MKGEAALLTQDDFLNHLFQSCLFKQLGLAEPFVYELAHFAARFDF